MLTSHCSHATQLGSTTKERKFISFNMCKSVFFWLNLYYDILHQRLQHIFTLILGLVIVGLLYQFAIDFGATSHLWMFFKLKTNQTTAEIPKLCDSSQRCLLVCVASVQFWPDVQFWSDGILEVHPNRGAGRELGGGGTPLPCAVSHLRG